MHLYAYTTENMGTMFVCRWLCSYTSGQGSAHAGRL